MRAETYNQLIRLGFDEEEARPMSEAFAWMLGGLGRAGYKLFGWVAKAILLSPGESRVAPILF